MTADNAAKLADEFIRLTLQNQPGLFGTAVPSMDNNEKAKRVAQAIAELRRELIALLEKQP